MLIKLLTQLKNYIFISFLLILSKVKIQLSKNTEILLLHISK